MAPILVTGGTGTLGRRVVPRLREAGAEVRVLSRRGHAAGSSVHSVGVESVGVESVGSESVGVESVGVEFAGVEFVTGDLNTGAGVEAAVDGVDVIVHCAGSAKGDEHKTRTLVQAASRAGVRHLVYISVVGADRVPVTSLQDRMLFGYFAAKLAAERVVAESGLPWSTLRTTQFHDSMLVVARQLAKLPVIPVAAGVRFQPVDTGEAAARLVEAALGEAAGLLPEFGGPRAYTMAELVRAHLRVEHKRRPTVPILFPGRAAKAVRAGANLTPDHADGRRSWEEFLTEEAVEHG